MKKLRILFWVFIILLPVIYLLFLRVPHIMYTESSASNIAALQNEGNTDQNVMDYLPKKGRNYHIKYNKSLSSIVAKFSITQEDLEAELKRYNITLSPKPSPEESFIPFLIDVDYNLKTKHFLFYLGKDNIWHNTQLEILYFPKESTCYIYSLGNY